MPSLSPKLYDQLYQICEMHGLVVRVQTLLKGLLRVAFRHLQRAYSNVPRPSQHPRNEPTISNLSSSMEAEAQLDRSPPFLNFLLAKTHTSLSRRFPLLFLRLPHLQKLDQISIPTCSQKLCSPLPLSSQMSTTATALSHTGRSMYKPPLPSQFLSLTIHGHSIRATPLSILWSISRRVCQITHP